MAVSMARRVSTSQRCLRYSMVPRISVIGLAASLAMPDAIRTVSSVAGFPATALPASSTNRGVGATDASVTLADAMLPLSRTTDTPAPATAMSISFLGMNRM